MNPGNAARRTMSVVAATLAMLPLGGRASAQSATDWTYEIGLRTTFMVSTMRLAELGGGFADLPAGGKALPHSSSIFVLWPLGQHVRVGIETLVGNSYPKSDTQMLFQASGLTAEYQTGGTWFVAAGVQAGGMIVSATQSPDSDAEGDAQGDGVHYKESGAFLSPQISLGRRLRRYEVKLVGRQVWQFGAAGVDAFDSFYAGISVGRLMR
jgi:hypothetical protein